MQHCTISCNKTECNGAQCNSLKYNTIQCNVKPCNTQCNALQDNTIRFRIIKHHTPNKNRYYKKIHENQQNNSARQNKMQRIKYTTKRFNEILHNCEIITLGIKFPQIDPFLKKLLLFANISAKKYT